MLLKAKQQYNMKEGVICFKQLFSVTFLWNWSVFYWKPYYNSWRVSVGKCCRDATVLKIQSQGNCREAQLERPRVVGGAAGRRESVRTTQEVVRVVLESPSGVGSEMRSKVTIGIATSYGMDFKWATRWWKSTGWIRLLFCGIEAFSIENPTIISVAPPSEFSCRDAASPRNGARVNCREAQLERPASPTVPQAGASRSAPPRRSLVSFLAFREALSAKWKANVS